MQQETIRELILRRTWLDIANVGITKSIGFIPRMIIKKMYHFNEFDIKNNIPQGSEFKLLDGRSTCIQNGALFVYNRNMFKSVLASFNSDLLDLKWKNDVDFVLNKIIKNWYSQDHAAMPLIRELYGDDRWESPTPAETEFMKRSGPINMFKL